MPEISTTSSPPWNLLPVQDKHRICQSLGPADLHSLRAVSAPWRDAVDLRLDDFHRHEEACKTWIAQADGGPLRGLTEPALPPLATHARALAGAGYSQLALLLTLERVRANLSSLPSSPPSAISHRMVACGPSPPVSGCVRMLSGDPLFFCEARQFEPVDYGIALCSRDGPLAPPDLPGARVCWNNQVGFLSRIVHGATTHGGPAELVVRCMDGRLALYCPEAATLHRLPSAFRDAPHAFAPDAAISANGRFVATHLSTDRLLVYDRHTGRLVTDATRARHDTAGFCVDAEGHVVTGEGRWGALCAKDRHLLEHGPDGRLLILDRQAPEEGGIALRSPDTWQGAFRPTSVGMSPAGVVLAVAYANNTVHLFDLLPARSGAIDLVEPACILRLPVTAEGRNPSLLFAPDGTHLDVVYLAETADARGNPWDTAVFLRYPLVP